MNPVPIFDRVARLYHEMRPRYPQELFDDLFCLTSLRRGSRILEIGAGTGIATVELAQRGFRVVALEPSAEMASVLRENLKDREAEVVVSSFEDWPPPSEKFDLVVSFTAFHWLNPKTRYRKVCDMLSLSGYLAVIRYHHVAGGDTSFFHDAQKCYRKYKPGYAEFRLPEASDVVSIAPELNAGGLFHETITRNYLAEVTYDRADYEKLLMTYSDHCALEEQKLSRLLFCIGSLIDNNYDGKIRKCYMHELVLARRR